MLGDPRLPDTGELRTLCDSAQALHALEGVLCPVRETQFVCIIYRKKIRINTLLSG